MSAEGLRQLYERHAFNPGLTRDWLTVTHVPFDDLLGSETVESRVRSVALGSALLSVIGGSGTGKTSLVNHALNTDGVAPIWLQVTQETPPPVGDPLGFGQLLLATIVDDARRLLTQSEVDHSQAVVGERYQRQGTRTSRRGGVGLTPAWLTLDMARELTTAAPDISRPVAARDVTRQIDELLDLVQSRGLMPVVVLDDTDRILQVVGGDPTGELLDRFVRRVLPWLAERNCGRILSVHPSYLSNLAWRAARLDGRVGEEVTVPLLTEAEHIATILSRRMEVFEVPGELTEIVEAEAVARLFELYAGHAGGTLRQCLTLAQYAVVLARDAGATSVGRVHVEGAAAELA
jgi:hypothetical protein